MHLNSKFQYSGEWDCNLTNSAGLGASWVPGTSSEAETNPLPMTHHWSLTFQPDF